MKSQPQRYTSLSDILEAQERERSDFLRLNPLEQARQQISWRAHYAKNPWAFLRDCVLTLDPVSQESPIKPFPSYLTYVEFLVKLWTREPLLAIPKSRRMFCSWSFISCFTQDTLFNRGRHNAFVSKKEDDSGDLVSRAEFIYKNIPEWRIPRALLPALKNNRMSKQPPLMEFEDIHSRIQGFPQGSDQMRQFTLSGALLDEWAFWEQAQGSYSSLKPTLDGGGRLTGISSRNPSFFKKIVFDRINAPDLTFRETPPVTPLKPMEGVELWRNPGNRFVVVDLHYTADPRKRSVEWRDGIKNSLPKREYEMEYERSWQTFEGKPVYGDFTRSIHLGKPKAEPGSQLLLGWDFGLTPACAITQIVGRQLRVLREFTTDGSISKLAPIVWDFLMLNYLPWMHADGLIRSYIDPAGFQRAQTDERTCADVLRCCADLERPEQRIGFTDIRPGPINWEARRKSVEDFLTKTYGEGPGLLIDEDHCPILIEGFGGGYRYPEKATDIEPADLRPLKNKWSHIHDGLQMAAAGALSMRQEYALPNTEQHLPSYGFQTP